MTLLTTEYFVQFQHPGICVAEQSSQRVEAPVNNKFPEFQWPASAYCVRLAKRTTAIVKDEYGDEKHLTSGMETITKTLYHPDSKIMSLSEVRQANTEGQYNILIANMEGNNWEHIIMTRFGNFPQPFKFGRDAIFDGNLNPL